MIFSFNKRNRKIQDVVSLYNSIGSEGVKNLIKNGEHVNIQKYTTAAGYSEVPLIQAVDEENYAIVRLLIELGADLEAKSV
jgi:ankyrin repeat protein